MNCIRFQLAVLAIMAVSTCTSIAQEIEPFNRPMKIPADLKPSKDTVTWRVTYYPAAKDAKSKVQDLVGPINQGISSTSAKFHDLSCNVTFAPESTSATVFGNGVKLHLYQRNLSGEMHNVSDKGFAGETAIFHPKSGSRIVLTAFTGPSPTYRTTPPTPTTVTLPNQTKQLSDYSEQQIKSARSHEKYPLFWKADSIYIGKVEVVEQWVTEEPIPTYSYQLKIYPTQKLRGNFPAKPITISWSPGAGVVARFVQGQDYLITSSRRSRPWTKIISATDELLDVASIAFDLQSEEQAELVNLAHNDPEKHPEFKKFQEAKGIALLGHFDDHSGVVFTPSRSTEETAYFVAHNFRGQITQHETLKLLRNTKSSGHVRYASNFFFATYSQAKNQWLIESTFADNEVNRRLIAHACSMKLAELKQNLESGKSETQRAQRKADASWQRKLDAMPASGHSRSFDPGNAK